MNSPTSQRIDPDPKIVADFLHQRTAQLVAALTLELAETFAGLQQEHQRAAIAEQRVAELEQVISTMSGGQGATQTT